MKRFVYIPHHLLENNPEAIAEAQFLAKDAQLSVREGSVGDGIGKNSVCIISVPEFSFCHVDETVDSGFILSVDITNEFVDMSCGVKMEITSPSGIRKTFKPAVLERHVAKFRERFNEVGRHEISVSSKYDKLLVSSFEVV